MISLDIYGGLLGCGKTTVIRKMLETTYKGQKVAVIENEIGKVNLDQGEFNLPKMSVKELTAGCVCCTIKSNFTEAVREIAHSIQPDVIILEPTGTAGMRDLIDACLEVREVRLNKCILIVNAKKLKALLSVVGEFFLDQIRTAHVVYLNFTETLTPEQKQEVVEKLLEINPDLAVVDIPLAQLDENSFPNQENEVFAESSAKGRAVIRVEELQNSTSAKIYPKNVRQLYTWTYQFQKPFTEEKIERLKELLADTEHCNLWRAKGILQMDNGTMKKIDLTFGDLFEENRDVAEDARAGTLVLIGKRMDTQWLSSKFKIL
jgi:G3E family GTPase